MKYREYGNGVQHRDGRYSLFLAMQCLKILYNAMVTTHCLGDVFTKTLPHVVFDDVLKKHNIVLAMYIIDDYFGTISRSTMEPKSTLKVQVHPMQQVFQSKYEFEDPLPNSY